MNAYGMLCPGVEMILPNLCVASRANQHWTYSGIDSPEYCQDSKFFDQYPHEVRYDYNSRGYRDHEWPDDHQQLKDSIWCVGDSFTVGIGQPFAHIWPQQLEARTGRRCINISMDGASNDWIYRVCANIVTAIQPRDLVVMWSFTHRRELDKPDIDDENRRIWYSQDSTEQDRNRWIVLSNQLGNLDCNVVQLTVPDFDSAVEHHDPLSMVEHDWNRIKDHNWPPCPRNLDEFQNLPEHIKEELQNLHGCYWAMRGQLAAANGMAMVTGDRILANPVIHVHEKLDLARDHYHFGILTSQWAVDKVKPHLSR